MPADLLKHGDFPGGLGGEFEKEVVKKIQKVLPTKTLLISSLSLTQNQGMVFYEYDLVVLFGKNGKTCCEVIEAKFFPHKVDVWEDYVRSQSPGLAPLIKRSIFSTVNSKCRVLKSRLIKELGSRNRSLGRLWVDSRVVFPDGATLSIKHKPYDERKLALHLSELEKMYRLAEPITEGFDIYKSILNGIVEKSSPRSQRLGQYLVLKPLETSGYRRDFKGRDVPPNEVDVMLTEYAWDVLWPEDEIKQFVKNISTEMRALRKLRHPYIACLTGHFVTPNSIVQVSDWFDGKSIRDYWDEGSEFSIREKLHIMINLGEALHYCHLNAIFHRNITERAILVSDDFQDVRLSRFDCAKMLDISGTLPTEKLTSRPIDHQAPEEFDSQSPVDSKKVDIFQFGVMMFRILFDGSRPFADSLEIDEDNPVFGELDELDSIDDSLRALIRKSLNADPKKRTDSMLEVVSKLREAIRNL